MVSLRTIYKSMLAIEQSEGAGARVRRSIGNMKMRNFDPFLMLDHFNVLPDAGFPHHPHLGQETITYITKGQMVHEDFNNHLSVLNPGDLQFMTAGKGIVHSEMPVKQEDLSNVVGMQLWVDLPNDLKESTPRYRDLRNDEIPIYQDDSVKVKVISGKVGNVESLKELAYTPMFYYHYQVKSGANFEQFVEPNFNTFLYILDGDLKINDKVYHQYDTLFFNMDGDTIKGEVPSGSKEADFVLIGGLKLNQNSIQHGPFVANSKERIMQGFYDYQLAQGPFSPLRTWETKISDGVDSKKLNKLLNVRDEL
ncbi:hypothetical protein HYPBUDRAFT_149306 [Hyphopichia burtonii NRRL Y-1933]|uniref:Pirin-like protein n=1 Tax=Hyphopichia burtonii NRRL Y-1933 TaxID=984485 RepID=A0A1E4RGP1_9ASCO|nr:hypothetical protein HYPBUDRAFT_149306 [Hyphopichia burtonii NRRL Y-1933]ODV66437.1 hypothetical protein HYPBUDRAFT_149306 [Hyphopichia burtonii NRRL Y-1933]